MGLENESWWGELLAKKDTVGLKDLAAEFGTTAGAISLALKRTGTPKVPQGDSVSSPESIESTRPGSKDSLIDPFASMLGSVPDAEVARRAGVSVRTIASYRQRNQITGFQGRTAPKQRRPRRSRIDPFEDLLGQVPDRVVAEKAGVTLNAVRNYRATRGIPASRGRGGDVQEQEVAAPVRAAKKDVVETEPPRRASASASASVSIQAPNGSAGYAWRILFEGEVSGIVTGINAAQAVERGASSGLGSVVGLERIGALL